MEMDFLMMTIFLIYGFSIFWAIIGYPISLRFLHYILKPNSLKKNYDNLPSVTILVVAHDEEKVIQKKLNNLAKLSYPKDRMKVVVSSDNSTDKTNAIVKRFINKNPRFDIVLYEVKERKGKTNAQNEAQKLVETEFLVMTDANSLFKEDAVIELMSAFTSDDIAYVCGRLVYINGQKNLTAELEANYWDLEMKTRKIESDFQTITAGNGAIYAVRNEEYIDINLLESHDSVLPYKFAIYKKKALFNEKALAFEKAGENIKDEFKRKVRMRRMALTSSMIRLKPLNIFKYRWFTYFYIGHRYLRDILWLSHALLLISNIYLSFDYKIFLYILGIHLTIYFIGLLQFIINFKNKFIRFLYYYFVTLLAQYIGVYKQLVGKSKPFWDKAESTR